VSEDPDIRNSAKAAPDVLGQPEVPSSRLIATLGMAGALAGLLLVFVFQWAQPRILAYQAEVLRQAIQEVLAGPARYETLFLVNGSLTNQLPPGVDSLDLERVYLGYDDSGEPVGFAIAGAEPGFQDIIRLLFGYDPDTGRILGMKVLENKETPGLGDKIEKDSVFVGRFEGVLVPLLGVKSGRVTGNEHEVVMITGATISSRTVIEIINNQIEHWGSLLNGFAGEPAQ
jgi:electron transport complex protein RnfG